MPKKQDIIDKAFSIYQKKNHGVSSITPELEEVKEDGTLIEARNSLMRSEDTEYKAYVEREARNLGLIDDKIEVGEQQKPYDFEIDIEEALRSGVFISGGKGTTKTNLAKIIADKLMKLGYTVKVFDISKAWLSSSISFYVEGARLNGNLYQSTCYDLSKLLPKDTKRFIAQVLTHEWNAQVSEEQRKWIVYVFEEVQSLIPQGHLRSMEAQVVLRLLTSGRNYKLGFIAITQRPALTDTSVFELTFQRYFARMDGQNDLRKVANYIGTEKARQLQSLKLGEFIYDKGTETKWIATKEFCSSLKPRKVEVAEPKPIPEKPYRKTQESTKAISSIMIALIWFLAIIIAVSQKPI